MSAAFHFLVCSWLVLFICGCERTELPSLIRLDAAVADKPLLVISPGDSWIYQVRLKIPAGVTSAGAAAVDTSFESTRTYLGKVSAAESLPAVDCFELKVPGSPTEREFVEILPDRILMRGSHTLRDENTRPLWLDQPAPFVIAGMRAGDALPEMTSSDGQISRRTRVIARETITVPGGAFRCIRLLTTGNDGELELRRTTWFAPGSGIIREEKIRYRRDQLVFREIQELAALKRAR